MQEGMKFDNGKLQMGLVHDGLAIPLEELGKILTYGAKKYAPNSWQNLDNAKSRYSDALYRHLNAYHRGETVDKESGLPHLSHALCNLSFLVHFEQKEQEKLNDH